MKRLFAFAGALGDRVNPVAVKEFRQAVQSRWVTSVLMLFLLINLTVIGGYLMLSTDAETSATGGRNVFTGLLVVLSITCIGFVPLYSGIRLSLERNDANIDLFFVTTITPGAIVRGKYLTAMALTLLIFSACMPFMILTYLLRGIDLPTIFLILACVFLACALANAMGVFAGCVPGSWLIRGVVDVGMLFLLFYMTIAIVGIVESTLIFGAGRGIFGARSMWGTIGSWILFEVVMIGLLHVYSVAMLSPKPSNRMLVPRLCLMGSWALAGIVMAVWSYIEGSKSPVDAWAWFSAAALTILLVAVLGERDDWTSRVRRRIPRNPVLRPIAFLFYSGSAGGILWCVLMFAATMAAATLWEGFCGFPGTRFAAGSIFDNSACSNLTITFGFVLCYCLTTAFLRTILFRSVPTPNLSVFAAFFGVAVLLVPYLTAFFMADRNWWTALPWYLVGSPMVLTMNNDLAKGYAVVVLMVWLALGLLGAMPWAIGQWRRFVPYRLEVPAE